MVLHFIADCELNNTGPLLKTKSPMSTKKSKLKSSSNGIGSKVAANVDVLPGRIKQNKTKLFEEELKKNHLIQLAGFVDSKELLRILTEVKNGNFSVRMP